MQITVTNRNRSWSTDLDQFCRDNSIDRDDAEVIRATLRAGAPYNIGGGAAPVFTLERAGK